LPHLDEQKEIGNFLKKMDSLITLHQRKPKCISKLT
ncbi:MAG: restriction endonuclease subunit S, partial [Lactobacillus sp.]|nr:restriction endonuclease subunit S [Lactobacillus sp.]